MSSTKISLFGYLGLLSFSFLTACNAGGTSPSNPSTAKIPYLIEAKLTDLSLQELIADVGPVKDTTNYLLTPDGGHMTIAYAPTQQQYNNLIPYLTNNMNVIVSEYCWSDQYAVEAAKATAYNSNNAQIIGTDPFQHITISFGNSKAAVDSNYLFECSAANYNSYSYCTENNLHIVDLKCKALDGPVTLNATLYESY